ncbi:outer membrane beta-barrel protein [Sulfurovum sp. zt1-1]|uniref:Outer membrane beta-barrel protein n=1 Tax=Sulfurovum zhangzhouensis TaxID=3019067 RepID=A0ABT7QWV5_9BACT|nr:outer membrane beta-barrel protein [Sulfurovum zhangzhouensis]MDM5271316.1 outer membrane beta-barrel protein [Sulfurovum zhangzhouensis]
MRDIRNKLVWTTIAAMVLQNTLYAGGKNIAPVLSPVAEIPQFRDPSPWYMGVGLVKLNYNGCRSNCEFEDITYGMMVRGGYEYNQHIGLEARGIWTGWEAEGAELEHHFGIFLKPMAPVGEDFNVYGLLGYGKTKIGGSYERAAMDESGFSWGVGIEYDLSGKEDDKEEYTIYDRAFDGQADQEKGWGIFIDYEVPLVNKQNAGGGDVDLYVISFGVTYDF